MAPPRPASLARRALPMLVVAGASGALLVKLDNPASSALPPADVAGDAAAPDVSTAPRSSGTVAPSEEASAGAGSSTATLPRTTPSTAKGTVTPPTTSAARPSATTAATAAPAAASTECSGDPVNGPTVNTRWGPVQVAAVFDGTGALCDVQVLQYPDSHGKSVRINQRALPVLTREALAAQSADINIVTGATITSDAYAQSLQSILDHR